MLKKKRPQTHGCGSEDVVVLSAFDNRPKRPSKTPLSPENGAWCISPARMDCQLLDPGFSQGNHAVRLPPCGTIRLHAAWVPTGRAISCGHPVATGSVLAVILSGLLLSTRSGTGTIIRIGDGPWDRSSLSDWEPEAPLRVQRPAEHLSSLASRRDLAWADCAAPDRIADLRRRTGQNHGCTGPLSSLLARRNRVLGSAHQQNPHRG